MLKKLLESDSPNTPKTELMKTFRGFRVFEYFLRQKIETRKCLKSTESFLNKKNTQCSQLP